MFKTNRKADHPIQDLILHRWSPRSFSQDPLSDEEIASLFEAARWAPSSYNNQPWRFLYAKKGTPEFPIFFNLLVEFNKSWCKEASILGVIASMTLFEHNQKPSPTHAFDTGAAWENLALEASSKNIVVHGMQGFDYEKARQELKIPNEVEVLAMFAAGKPGPLEELPKNLQEKEKPSQRKPIQQFVFEGIWTEDKKKSSQSSRPDSI